MVLQWLKKMCVTPLGPKLLACYLHEGCLCEEVAEVRHSTKQSFNKNLKFVKIVNFHTSYSV